MTMKEVILLGKFSQTKPQGKNMKIDNFVLYHTVPKNLTEEGGN